MPPSLLIIEDEHELVRSLVCAGLLDVLNLSICPVVVGSGMHLFDEITNMLSLKLIHSTILSNGVIGATYQPVQAGSPTSEPPISFPQAAVRK